MASVHSSRQYSIPSHCDVDRIPSVVAVMNRRVFHYSGHWQARNIRNFVKNTLPSWTISEVLIYFMKREFSKCMGIMLENLCHPIS